VRTITMLSGGFILTSLLWATALARLIDGRFRSAAVTFVVAGTLAMFGVIHSPLPSERVMLPGRAVAEREALGRFEAPWLQTPCHWAGADVGIAMVVVAVGRLGHPPAPDDPHA